MKELEPIKKIIRTGLDVAKGYDASSIRPVHLFMGIIKHANNSACDLLLNLGLDLDSIAEFVEELLHINEIESSFNSIIPFTTEAQMVLDNVNSERLLLKDKEVNTHHLALSILFQKNAAITRFLSKFGVEYKTYKKATPKKRSRFQHTGFFHKNLYF